MQEPSLTISKIYNYAGAPLQTMPPHAPTQETIKASHMTAIIMPVEGIQNMPPAQDSRLYSELPLI